MRIAIEFEPRDLWIGVYWKRRRVLVAGCKTADDLHVWVCLVPCFPIHIAVRGTPQPHVY